MLSGREGILAWAERSSVTSREHSFHATPINNSVDYVPTRSRSSNLDGTEGIEQTGERATSGALKDKSQACVQLDDEDNARFPRGRGR